MSHTGSFSQRLRPKSPVAKSFCIPKEQCVVATVDDTVGDVLTVLLSCNFARRRCYVCDKSGTCVGMVGLGAIVRLFNAGKPRNTKIGEVLQTNVCHCGPDDPLDACRALMGRERKHYCIVTKNGKRDGAMIGTMTSWLVAQEQSVQSLAYPHNRLQNKYTTWYQKLSPAALQVLKGAVNAKM